MHIYTHIHTGKCLACGAGYFSGGSGATTCRNCTALTGNFCPPRSAAAGGEPCPAGFCCAGGHHDKEPCPAGTFKEATGAGHCSQCLAGTFSAEEAAVAATACRVCAAGTFSSAHGASSCVSCPRGSVSPPGSSSVANCTRVLAAGTGPHLGDGEEIYYIPHSQSSAAPASPPPSGASGAAMHPGIVAGVVLVVLAVLSGTWLSSPLCLCVCVCKCVCVCVCMYVNIHA